MSKNLIRRQSYLCDPLTWTPRSVYGDVPRCLSWGGGGGANRGGGVKKNFWQPSLINGLFGPRSCWSSKTQCSPTKIRLHLRNILIKDSPCPEKKKKTTLFLIRWDRRRNLRNLIIRGHKSLGDNSRLSNRGSSLSACEWALISKPLAGKPSISFWPKETPQGGRWLCTSWANASLQWPTFRVALWLEQRDLQGRKRGSDSPLPKPGCGWISPISSSVLLPTALSSTCLSLRGPSKWDSHQNKSVPKLTIRKSVDTA